MSKVTDKYPFEFTDISYWQGPDVDFGKMRDAGARGVIVRATIGNNYVDPTLPRNWEEAGKAGLLRGAYMVVVPGQAGQVAAYQVAMGDRAYEADIPHTIDLEIWWRYIKGKRLREWVRIPHAKKTMVATFVQTYADFLNWSEHPLVYTNKNMAHRMGNPAALEQVEFRWVASYSDTATEPVLPAGWDGKPVQMWQWSADHNGQGPKYGGGASAMDLNRVQPEFYEMLTGAADPPPEPPQDDTMTVEQRLDRLEKEVFNQG